MSEAEAKVESVAVEADPLFAAILEARRNMGSIGKSGYNEFDNYYYSTLGDYLDSIVPPCLEASLLVHFEEAELEFFQSTSAKMPNGVRAKVAGIVHHVPSGRERRWVQTGEAFDKGDKAIYKAITGGRKYLLQSIFNLYGEDDPERDSVPDDDRGTRTRGQRSDKRNGSSQSNNRPRGSDNQEAPQSEAQSQKGPNKYTWDQFKNSIDRAKNPDRLVTFIDKCGAMQQLIDDPELTQQVFDHAADVLKAKREAGTWSAEECDCLSKRLSHNYNALTLEHDAAKPPLTFETIAGQIDGILKSKSLCEYLERAEASEALLADIPLLKRLMEKAGESAYAKLQASKWTAQEVDDVEAVITRIKLKIEGTKPDTAGTQGELINE